MMTREQALIEILVEWAIMFERSTGLTGDGDIEVLHERTVMGKGIHRFNVAIMVWFGTNQPSEEDLDKFIDKYSGWMSAISSNLTELMLGETTIDKVIVIRVIAEMDM